MRFYWDLATNSLLTTPGIQQPIRELEFKRGDSAQLEIQFVRDTEIVELDQAPEIRFALKPQGEYDADPVVFSPEFIPPAEPDGFYIARPNFNTTELNELLNHGDDDPTNDVPVVTLMAEFTFREDPESTDWTSTATFSARVHNDVIKGDEGTPTSAADPTAYLTAEQSNARFVRHDDEQSLDAGAQAQARENIGLDQVDNTADADKPISNATSDALESIADDLSEHVGDTDNPHEVTKAQVGLGNVDNTSDVNKPISNATQTALNGKSDTSHTHGTADIVGGPPFAVNRGGTGLSVLTAGSYLRAAGIGSFELRTPAQVRTDLDLQHPPRFFAAGELVPPLTGGARPLMIAGGLDAYALDDTVVERIYLTGRMFPQWSGANLRARFFWRTAAATGDVRWTTQAERFDDDDAIGTSNPAFTAGVTDGSNGAGDLNISGWVDVDISGTGPFFRWQFGRDPLHGDDDMTGDAHLLGVEIDFRP